MFREEVIDLMQLGIFTLAIGLGLALALLALTAVAVAGRR